MMNKDCKDCDYYSDGACLCPSIDKWYACPIEESKPENQQALRELAERGNKMGDMTCKEMNEWAKTFYDGLMNGLNGGGEENG